MSTDPAKTSTDEPMCAHCGQNGKPIGTCHLDQEPACTECGFKSGLIVEHKPRWCWNIQVSMYSDSTEENA